MSVLFNNGNPKAALMKGKKSSVSVTTDETETTTTDTTTDTTTGTTTGTTSDVSNYEGTKGYRRHGPVEFPSNSTKSKNVINVIDSMSENSQGLNQQMGHIVKQFDAMGEVNNGSVDAMDQDSSVMMMKNLYGYGGWVIVSLLIIVGILIFGFNLIPSLNNRMMLMNLTIVLGIVSTVLIVLKYNLWDVFLSFLNKFIYYN